MFNLEEKEDFEKGVRPQMTVDAQFREIRGVLKFLIEHTGGDRLKHDISNLFPHFFKSDC